MDDSQLPDMSIWLHDVRASQSEALQAALRQKESRYSTYHYHGKSADTDYTFTVPEGLSEDLGVGSVRDKSQE
jgi:hypothetical protein